MRYRQNTKGDILYGPPVIVEIPLEPQLLYIGGTLRISSAIS